MFLLVNQDFEGFCFVKTLCSFFSNRLFILDNRHRRTPVYIADPAFFYTSRSAGFVLSSMLEIINQVQQLILITKNKQYVTETVSILSGLDSVYTGCFMQIGMLAVMY